MEPYRGIIVEKEEENRNKKNKAKQKKNGENWERSNIK